MKPVSTKRMRAILRSRGCVFMGTEGSHEKWQTPGGLSYTIVAASKEQSAGLVRGMELTFAPNSGAGWLTKELK